MKFNIKNNLECFFIDNRIHTKSKKHIIEDNAEEELEFLENEV